MIIFRGLYNLFGYCDQYGTDWITLNSLISEFISFGYHIACGYVLFKRKPSIILVIFTIIIAFKQTYSLIDFYLLNEPTVDFIAVLVDLCYLIEYIFFAIFSIYVCIPILKEKANGIKKIWFLPALCKLLAILLYYSTNPYFEHWHFLYLNAWNYISDTSYILVLLIICYWLKTDFVEVNNAYEIFHPEMLERENDIESEGNMLETQSDMQEV